MDVPTLFEPRRAAPDTDVLPAYTPVPGLGILPVNAYLIDAAEPVLVDTGLRALGSVFVDELRTRIDLDDLRWIWITHADPDHIGALARLLDEAPNARLITTYLGMGKLDMMMPIPLERVYLLNPGQRLDVGDRQLEALRPPAFDAPETTACFDTKTGALFSADAFGALLSEPAEDAASIPAPALANGQIFWGTVDAPWLHLVAADALEGALQAIRTIAPSIVLSSHLPPAEGMLEVLLANLSAIRTAPQFIGPDQADLVAMASPVPPTTPPSASP
jgi:flavorubredoxin